MKNNSKWITKIFIMAFVFSIIFSLISSVISEKLPTFILPIILVIVIAIGIIFDMVGVAVLTSKEANLHAKASKKLKGAKEAISLLKNATQVSSICNDVIGDICGIVSGSLGAVLTIVIVDSFDLPSLLITVLVTAIISALTVGFKAICKGIATKNSDSIVFIVGKIKYFLHLK